MAEEKETKNDIIKWLKIAGLGLLGLAAASGLVFLGYQVAQRQALEPTPTPQAFPSPIPIATLTPTPKPMPKETSPSATPSTSTPSPTPLIP